MVTKEPFTPEENKVMDLLIEAHNAFAALERKHPSELQDWVALFHHLQDLLICRVAYRDYPEYFTKTQGVN